MIGKCKILCPYKRVNAHLEGEEYVREYLNGGFNNYIFISEKWLPVGWRIVSFDLRHFSGTNTIKTVERAKEMLDKLLLDNGYTLLDDWDMVDKYRLIA